MFVVHFFLHNMSYLIKPKAYDPKLDLRETERAIKLVKDFFQMNISSELGLRRVTAPLFVLKGTGINDDLNGTENKVHFNIKDYDNKTAEVVNSLAKWKRLALADNNIETGYGLYTDMNAIRPDEDLGNLHSLYVDQWDWELAMNPENRTIDYLKYIVKKLYAVLKRTETFVYENFQNIKPILPEEITFIHTEDLYQAYPNLSQKEREDEAAKKYGAVFITGIGSKLSSGEKHDGRAPDYDDWSTESENGHKGLNGDIVVWNSILERSFELSSMGIRVSPESLIKQLEIEDSLDRKELLFHKKLLNGELPQSIGGGIGQSRLCMFFLRKAHIGEIQASIWPDSMIKECADANIPLI